MKNTHDLILDYLQSNPLSSVAELSQALHLTKADIRYQLKQLINQQMVEAVDSHAPHKKGRPGRSFRLALKTQKNNFADLADFALAIISQSNNEFPYPLVPFFIAAIPVAKQRTTQLNRLVAFLTEHGYQARWEAYVNGPRILFRNCPYAAILAKHPELCEMDTAILSDYLKLPFHQTARIDLEYAKIPACIFMVILNLG